MRHDHNRPFDIEADEANDTTTQFWGATRGWEPRDTDLTGDDLGWQARTTGSLQAIRNGFGGGRRQRPTGSTGRLDRTRSHGVPRPQLPLDRTDADANSGRGRIDREATLGELASGWIDDNDWPDNWSAPTQRVAAVERPRPASRQQPTPRRQPPSRQQPAVPASTSRAPKRSAHHVEVELDDDVTAHVAARRTPVQALTERLGVGAVDPLLIRLSAIVLIGLLFVPFAVAARSGDGHVGTEVAAALPNGVSVAGAPAASSAPSAAPAPTVAPAPAATPTERAVATAATVADQPTTTASATTAVTIPATAATTAVTTPSSTLAGALVEPAIAEEPAKRVEPVCALTYDAVVGDSWYRIADAAGITPRQLLDANLAMLDTPIFPGDEICLPEGASMPAPPTTTEAPTTTVATTAAPTTRPPSTTAAPTTTAAPVTAPPAPTATAAQVQQMIRDIWPDELEQRALEIAYRESRYVPTAFNGWCCYGVFQIYYTVHDGWLDEIGVNRASDLYDPQKNITAAYMIYQRAGGWGPWGG